ncbi:hypothetical protein H310_05696 [Aphanomyces invadans]|uniref:Cilia- and flagella-associated protein 36 n=1 Tax=Aphanomyces invadans TaxID=157072 RepID=A0A024U6N2_9STRA|nr:hypothetical protein H310_05696 [Aphanomyces invadans]ETW02091.1 hypothetical protein H310_05696 [Aphanomyces invadans]|eukprot:XP_008868696.1 hypothetical protein H310_05696 [Aphanomyces invadans]
MPTESKDARDDRDDDDDAKGSCRSNHVDSKGADDDYDEDDNIVTKVMTYFFENQEFNQAFQDFAERECDVFDTEDEAEMKLEYTDVFNRFTALFESKLEVFIESQGSTVKDFYTIVKRAYENDPESTLAVYSQMLVSVCDFSVFVLMMRRTRDAMMLQAARK